MFFFFFSIGKKAQPLVEGNKKTGQASTNVHMIKFNRNKKQQKKEMERTRSLNQSITKLTPESTCNNNLTMQATATNQAPPEITDPENTVRPSTNTIRTSSLFTNCSKH